MARLAAFLGAPAPDMTTDLPEVRSQSVGKWRERPAAQLEEIRAIMEPTLGAFGYDWRELASPGDTARRVLDRTSRFFAGPKFFGGAGVSVRPRAEPRGAGGAVQGPNPTLIAP